MSMPVAHSPRGEAQHHIQCRPGDVGRYVFLPGDPGRVPLIAAALDDARQVAQNREYNVYTGSLLGEAVSVASTGIGCPSTAIAVEELAAIGADTFIRVGTSGRMQPFIEPGDLLITWGAVRDEFTSQQYLPLAYPAVADHTVILALRQAARQRGARHHVGITHSKDSFFGQHAPQRMPVGPDLINRWNAWVQAGVVCSEMEASTLFVVARLLGKRAGGIMLAGGTLNDLTNIIATAVQGVRNLIEHDRAHPPQAAPKAAPSERPSAG
ncbi:MAG: nucleoside phosphorylase [Anaerolineales bacterium]|nr:nucleoside phosphorylase [Anaerolineales bacterium]